MSTKITAEELIALGEQKIEITDRDMAQRKNQQNKQPAKIGMFEGVKPNGQEKISNFKSVLKRSVSIDQIEKKEIPTRKEKPDWAKKERKIDVRKIGKKDDVDVNMNSVTPEWAGRIKTGKHFNIENGKSKQTSALPSVPTWAKKLNATKEYGIRKEKEKKAQRLAKRAEGPAWKVKLRDAQRFKEKNSNITEDQSEMQAPSPSHEPQDEHEHHIYDKESTHQSTPEKYSSEANRKENEVSEITSDHNKGNDTSESKTRRIRPRSRANKENKESKTTPESSLETNTKENLVPETTSDPVKEKHDSESTEQQRRIRHRSRVNRENAENSNHSNVRTKENNQNAENSTPNVSDKTSEVTESPSRRIRRRSRQHGNDAEGKDISGDSRRTRQTNAKEILEMDRKENSEILENVISAKDQCKSASGVDQQSVKVSTTEQSDEIETSETNSFRPSSKETKEKETEPERLSQQRPRNSRIKTIESENTEQTTSHSTKNCGGNPDNGIGDIPSSQSRNRAHNIEPTKKDQMDINADDDSTKIARTRRRQDDIGEKQKELKMGDIDGVTDKTPQSKGMGNELPKNEVKGESDILERRKAQRERQSNDDVKTKTNIDNGITKISGSKSNNATKDESVRLSQPSQEINEAEDERAARRRERRARRSRIMDRELELESSAKNNELKGSSSTRTKETTTHADDWKQGKEPGDNESTATRQGRRSREQNCKADTMGKENTSPNGTKDKTNYQSQVNVGKNLMGNPKEQPLASTREEHAKSGKEMKTESVEEETDFAARRRARRARRQELEEADQNL